MKNRLFNILLILAAFLITCAAVATGSYFRSGMSVTLGSPSPKKIKATARVENKIATDRNKAEAEARAEYMEPLWSLDLTVRDKVNNNLDAFFIKLDAIRSAYDDWKKSEIDAEHWADEQRGQEAYMSELEERLTVDMENPLETSPPVETPPATETSGYGLNAVLSMFTGLSVTFTESQRQYIVTIPDDKYNALIETVHETADNALEQGVQALDTKTLLSIRDELFKGMLEEESANIGYEIVTVYLIPNKIINTEATNQEREKIAADYETVYLQKDQTIIDEGEIIYMEQYTIMESLGMINTGFEDKLIPFMGACMIIAVVFGACLLYLAIYRKVMAARKKESFLLFTLYCFVLAVTWTISELDYPFIPLLIFPMLTSILIDFRSSLLLTVGFTIISSFVFNGSMDYLLFFMPAGVFMCLLARYTTERNKIFIVGLASAAVNFILCCAIALVMEKNNAIAVWPDTATRAGYAALNGMLTVIACIGSLPFWEAFFGVVTPVKLLDLTNPTNMLLRRLTIEAPGTYHHSLIVANLAETAAYDIGANPATARAGGYYHDIGKLKFPHYFAENLSGENPHDSMDPFNSAQLIISHVTYGLTLASEYRLPQFIRDIIQEHHGTTLIQYFYYKAKSEKTDQPVNEKDFRYPYVKPQSRESACIMLADTVEAAVRSMIPRVKSINEVEDFITTLIRDKLNDGQLSDSKLSIKDIDIISQSFFRVLKGMYHERIVYPKKPEPEKDNDNKDGD